MSDATQWARGGLRRMAPRDPGEPHRAASPLELLFDLVFVVAVSFSAEQLHELLAEGRIGAGVGAYLMLFFAIWWAWMNFTWFATSFDTDDWLYRVTTIVQMGGALVVAAGSGPAMQHGDFSIVTIGYVVMRLALVFQWLRAAAAHPPLRGTALRYALGIAVVQVFWVLRLLLPDSLSLASFLVLALAEIAVPVWAERRRATPSNTHHIAERYSLFTLILLGESILAAADAIVVAIEAGEQVPELIGIAGAGLVVIAGMWWVYFAREHHGAIRSLRSSFVFGYTHYAIFAAAGAFSAGIAVVVDSVLGEAEPGPVAAAATLTVPVAAFLLGVWALLLRRVLGGGRSALLLAGVAVVLAGTAAGGLAAVVIAACGVLLAVVAVEWRPRAAAVR